ncbi:unnamed protein product [Rhizoctonia solani]|uniref:Uncharacterized protein n=1 Tax=Rhizoctonia solani TaxID=456999 RepID=A0A8H3DWM9_9AGAM|nr:unnamed protein product [Rhizoctonia solani]
MTGNSNVHLEILDCTSFQSVQAFLERWEQRPIKMVDILINNAGSLSGTVSLTRDNFEQTYQSNHLAHVLLTHELLDRGHISPTGRIVSLSSGGLYLSNALNENNATGRDIIARYDAEIGRKISPDDMIQLYVRTKLSQAMWTMALQKRLSMCKRWGDITAHCCHPDTFGVSSEQGAVTPVWLATALEPASEELRGRYWDRKQWQWLAPWALDEQRQDLLWDMWCRDAGAPLLFRDTV